jgi:general secretion pathway protein M
MSVIEQAKAKYQSLDKRERQVLTFGVIALSILLIFNLVYRPLATAQQDLTAANEQDKALLIWMKQAVMQIQQAGTDNSLEQRAGRNLNQILNSSASRYGISISRSQPRDNNQHQIWLDEVEFDKALTWINQLQNSYGIYVSSINLTTSEKKGFVRANITFQDAAIGS